MSSRVGGLNGFEPGPGGFRGWREGHERADEFGFGRSGFFESQEEAVRSILYFVPFFRIYLSSYMSL